MSPELRSAVICDLIRTENTGKHILIGVYSGDIAFQVLPGVLSPHFYFELSPKMKNGDLEFEMEIAIPGREEPISLTGSLAVNEENSVVIILNIPSIQVAEPGFITALLRFGGEEWIEAMRKRVIVQPVST